ncbi:MAG: hypothetical protein LBR66_04650 [Candidatus Symbiothrix sp.]|nr:hypothetical protein [Candidatus Symbiothrix sp.]
MNAYRFNTRISERGVIALPRIPRSLHNIDAEIVILPLRKQDTSKSESKRYSAMDFVSDFSGIVRGKENISDEELDTLKYEYLNSKHQ